MRKTLLSAAMAVLLAAAPALADQPPPKVLVSVKPLHGLAAMVMKDVAEPGLLVGGAASPHGYALKPSDRRALDQADLLVWVGKDFETWLDKPAAKVKTRLAMRDVPGMKILPTREGGVWGAHDDHDHHGHDEVDGHLWLDPVNAALLAQALAERLAALDPGRAAAYRANAEAAKTRIARLDADLRARLTPVAAKPYVVFHDAQQYFEARYGLNPAGAMTVDPDRALSGKRLAALRDRLKASGAACVFREPRFGAKAAQTLADSAGARSGELDPEGALVDPGPESYVTLMERLGAALAECLSAR